MAKILVADDQESMRQIISNLLKEAGHSVTIVEDGAQALDELQKSDFDLIVADVNMPRLNGLEFLKKAKEAKPGTKIVFVTGMLEESVRLAAQKMDLDGLILKPFDQAGALETINKVLIRI